MLKSAGGSGAAAALSARPDAERGHAVLVHSGPGDRRFPTRPDWCWRTGEVAFNFGPDIWVGVVDCERGELQTRSGRKRRRMNYPTWFPDGETLAVENYATSAQGPTVIPCRTRRRSTPRPASLSARTLEGLSLWGGMPSVNPVNPNLIAFAGQPVSGSDLQSGHELYLRDGHVEHRRRPIAARIRSADQRNVQSELSGPGAVVVAGRQVGRVRVQPAVAITKPTASTPFTCTNTAAPSPRCRSRARSTIAITRNGFRTASLADRPAPSS